MRTGSGLGLGLTGPPSTSAGAALGVLTGGPGRFPVRFRLGPLFPALSAVTRDRPSVATVWHPAGFSAAALGAYGDA